MLADPPEKIGSPVELRFINEGTEAVFIREVYGCSGQWFELRQGDEILDEDPGGCDTCKEILEGMRCGACSQVACLGLSFVRIEPGATFTVTWPGAIYEEIAWPSECEYDETRCAIKAPETCVTPKAPVPGEYAVRVVEAFAPSMCSGGTCECPGGAQTCEIATDMYESFEDIVVLLDLPGDEIVEFRLQ